MKKTTATIGTTLLLCLPVAGHALQKDPYEWPSSLLVNKVDLDRSGQPDSARLGIGPDSVGLLVTIDSTPLPIIKIPIDGAKQFGICPGARPTIRMAPKSQAPLDASGQMPHGYQACPECAEIVVSAGECDALHFYWDTLASKLAWWRA